MKNGLRKKDSMWKVVIRMRIESLPENVNEYLPREQGITIPTDKEIVIATDKGAVKLYKRLRNIGYTNIKIESKLPSNADIMGDYWNMSYSKHYKTGFETLDVELNGGLVTGVTMLGAVSGCGKTTLALQIADNIAISNEAHVLYFAMEMRTVDLIAKSISRIAHKHGYNVDENSVCNSMGANDEINKYKDLYGTYAHNIPIIDGTRTATEIRDITELYHAKYNDLVVVIDYIQIIKGELEKATDKMNLDNNIAVLKDLATKLNIPVLAISSINRESSKDIKDLTLQSFNGSGNLEYTAETVLGLQYRGVKDEKELKEARKKEIRPLELLILKNRHGRINGEPIELDFECKYSNFKDVVKKQVTNTLGKSSEQMRI